MDVLSCVHKTGEEKLGYLAEAAEFKSLEEYCAHSNMKPRKLRDWERQLEKGLEKLRDWEVRGGT